MFNNKNGSVVLGLVIAIIAVIALGAGMVVYHNKLGFLKH